MTDYIAVSRGGDLPGMAGHEVAMACKELTSAALDANFATAQELAASYGDEWTKWHTRTTWVVKRNGR